MIYFVEVKRKTRNSNQQRKVQSQLGQAKKEIDKKLKEIKGAIKNVLNKLDQRSQLLDCKTVQKAIENSVSPAISTLYMVIQMKYKLNPKDLSVLEREIQKKIHQLEKDLQKELVKFCKKFKNTQGKKRQKRYTVRKRTR